MSAPDNPLLRVLRKHFPDAAALHTQSADLEYNELTFTHDLDVAGVNIEEQSRLLRDLEKHLRLAATAIFALQPRVREKLEAVHKANVEERRGKTPRLATVDRLSSRSGPPLEVVVDAMNLLSRLHLGLLGKWPAADRWKTIQSESNAIRVTIDHLASLRVETAQARSHKTWEKVIFTSKAREAWELLGGEEAPRSRLNPETRFAVFMADLIEALGEDWKPVSTFNAWRKVYS